MTRMMTIVVASILSTGCASYPLPTQRLADAEAAQRGARELGAESKTAAQLNLKLADEQIAKAKAAIEDGDNKRADFLLMRAKADAEASLALAREQDALTALQSAQKASSDAAITNGATK